jgi:hypothetical protein
MKSRSVTATGYGCHRGYRFLQDEWLVELKGLALNLKTCSIKRKIKRTQVVFIFICMSYLTLNLVGGRGVQYIEMSL